MKPELADVERIMDMIDAYAASNRSDPALWNQIESAIIELQINAFRAALLYEAAKFTATDDNFTVNDVALFLAMESVELVEDIPKICKENLE
jgi:hypothetical protein